MLTVGQVAKKTGISVKALHHYDDIGLLKSPHRSASGYRLYGQTELQRLKQITLLKSLGFSLQAISELINKQCDLAVFIDERIKESERLLADRQRELNRLQQLKMLHGTSEQTIESLLHDMELITMHEKYFNEEQLKFFEQQRNELGEEALKQSHTQWENLIKNVANAVSENIAPDSDEALNLAKQWQDLILQFTGGDESIHDSLGQMYQQEKNFAQSQGMTAEVMEFIHQALEKLKQVDTSS